MKCIGVRRRSEAWGLEVRSEHLHVAKRNKQALRMAIASRKDIIIVCSRVNTQDQPAISLFVLLIKSSIVITALLRR